MNKYYFELGNFIITENNPKYEISINNQIKKVCFEEITNKNIINKIPIVNTIYAKCNESAIILDKIYRNYFLNMNYRNYNIISVKAIAGSGKTTLLLNFAKNNYNSKILYLAFNKSIIEDTIERTKKLNLNNIEARTFDSFLYRIAKLKFSNIVLSDINIDISKYFPKLNNENKKKLIFDFNNFCLNLDLKEEDIQINSNLYILWNLCKKGNIITFDSIRKLAVLERWCLNIIDKKYNIILIDEAQDFDPIMLEILLKDTSITKIFVGDPLQAIYQFRGAINAFEKLPNTTLELELYTSNRIGFPACKYISEKCNCIMLPKDENKETLIYFNEIPKEPYVYIFRNWKNILLEAQNLKNIYIFDFDSKIKKIKDLYYKLKSSPNIEINQEFGNELPSFLLKMSYDDLKYMEKKIMKNLVKFDEANIKIYTIHSYKGCEENIVRIYNDIDKNKEPNLYYVALTRGKKKIYLDNKKNILNIMEKNNIPDRKISDFFNIKK